MCPSIEELKNVWLPFSIRMKMSKSKGLDVCNWTDGDEMQVVEKLGRGWGNQGEKVGAEAELGGRWNLVQEKERKLRPTIYQLRAFPE